MLSAFKKMYTQYSHVYTGDEGTGTVVTDHAGGWNLTLTAAPTWDAEGFVFESNTSTGGWTSTSGAYSSINGGSFTFQYNFELQSTGLTGDLIVIGDGSAANPVNYGISIRQDTEFGFKGFASDSTATSTLETSGNTDRDKPITLFYSYNASDNLNTLKWVYSTSLNTWYTATATRAITLTTDMELRDKRTPTSGNQLRFRSLATYDRVLSDYEMYEAASRLA